MHLPSFLLAAIITTVQVVHADFLIVTDGGSLPKLSKTFTNMDEAQKWQTSIINEANSKQSTWMAGQGPSFEGIVTSAIEELKEFVETATYNNLDIVTATTAVITYTTVPPWYTALPTDAREVLDKVNNAVVSNAREVFAAAAAPTRAAGLYAGVVVAAAAGAAML